VCSTELNVPARIPRKTRAFDITIELKNQAVGKCGNCCGNRTELAEKSAVDLGSSWYSAIETWWHKPARKSGV
jgi:hypothetical protein